MCPKIPTSQASSRRFAQAPLLPLIIEARHSPSAWAIWAASHGTLALASLQAGLPAYVKTLIGAAWTAHAWRSRPQRPAPCTLHAGGWRVAIRGCEQPCELAAASYTRYWAELTFAAPAGRRFRVLCWRDALPRLMWRRLIVHLHEASGGDPPPPPLGAGELDVGRRGE